jgi:hypothetical protein
MSSSKISAVAIFVNSKTPPYTMAGSDPQNTGTHAPKELVEMLMKELGVRGHGVFTITFVSGEFGDR